MAKVYAFPVKKELPEEMLKRLNEIAKAYVILLNDVYVELVSDVTNGEEVAELTEVMFYAYIDAVEKAIAELEES